MNTTKEMMGKRVAFTHHYVQRWNHNAGYRRVIKKWCREAEEESGTGWIVGFRTIYDTDMTYEGSGYRPRFGQEKRVKSHQCVLIAKTPRSKPIRVPIDCFEIID